MAKKQRNKKYEYKLFLESLVAYDTFGEKTWCCS